MIKGVDVLGHTLGINMDDKIQAQALGGFIAHGNHFLEFPAGVDMHQWKRRLCRIKRLHGEMQHDSGILAHRIKHDRFFTFSGHLTDDVQGFCFKPI